MGCNGTRIHTENFRYACVLKYSIVLTTARVELRWKLPVLYIVTFDKKQFHLSNDVHFFLLQEIQAINAVLMLFDLVWQIAV